MGKPYRGARAPPHRSDHRDRTCSKNFKGLDGAHAIAQRQVSRSQLLQNFDFAYPSFDLGQFLYQIDSMLENLYGLPRLKPPALRYSPQASGT